MRGVTCIGRDSFVRRAVLGETTVGWYMCEGPACEEWDVWDGWEQ